MPPKRRLCAQQQRRIRRHIHHSDANAFFNLLTSPELLSDVQSLVPPHRERVFPPTETLSMFLAQAFHADRSCQSVVNDTAVKRLARGLPSCSTHTGAYCRARQRLPISMLSTLVRQTGQRITAQAPEPWHWRGRPVRLVDGTTVVLPDTPANQAAYPQSRSQKPGLGFPLCRIVGLLCLESGAVLNAAIGRYQGKGGDEQTLLRSIVSTLEHGDLLVGDAFYATYFLLCSLRELGIDAVFEQYGARQRRTDCRCGQRLGSRDHLIVLQKPIHKPDWMSQADYDQAPSTLMVRELRTGGKTLVTTLLCPKATHKSALKTLFQSRWHVEWDLRTIKSTLGMEQLSCQTPTMVIKEMWVHLLAYNLIRLMMAQAALRTDTRPRQLSFKHTLQLWIAWEHHGHGGNCDSTREGLWGLIAQQRVGNRPGRLEPRAIKRRPKPYPLLTKPRAIARADIRKHGHPAKLK
ncbi:MAG: IS4 family transposase [Nitrospira sp.]|nr:IS4 family transposase [Nitrospira sp.]MBL8053785.1 IS4 family transposase [Nitrospira sp.]